MSRVLVKIFDVANNEKAFWSKIMITVIPTLLTLEGYLEGFLGIFVRIFC